jgi:hypothetical protein
VTAVFFLLLAIIFLVRRDTPVLPALCIGAAALSRQPVVLAVPAFLYYMAAQRYSSVFSRDFVNRVLQDRQTLTQAGIFLGVLIPFGLFSLWYNDVRFGGIFDTGLDEIYNKYGGVPYTPYLAAQGERFAEFDIRNIPIHIYTMFLLPPEFSNDGSLMRPSWYGMSILLTSSPLIYSVFVRRRDPLKVASWIALALIPLPTLVYYSAGWVQFGYRYILDYLPFLLVLTTFGFEDNQSPTSFRIKVALVVLSIAIGFWGRYWGTRLGW